MKIKLIKNNGFSLAEIMAAVLISAMVLVAALTVYSRSQKTVAAVFEKIDKPRLSQEILQRIAEDLDSIISDGSETTIAIQNSRTGGYASARLTITKMIFAENNQKKLYEQIIWATGIDPESESNSLILYRSHRGLAIEDKLLEQSLDQTQREQFIPICDGLTFFRVAIPQSSPQNNSDQPKTGIATLPSARTPNVQRDGDILSWTGQNLPKSVIVSLSAAEPIENSDGTLDVYEEDIALRTIAIDRTRKIKFEIPKYESPDFEQTDSNEPDSNTIKSNATEPNETR
ncbi:MAG: prepilin-type N-terminal cleavage/methylation domain-containing protein [Phycisphaerae bacterium]|nr:prepilin-type N-terminal cleavage/methylation domain-containing protein [Phycisphaerae bacterium]